MNRQLAGKQIVVTGARSGIGLATVEKLAEQGADVWACMRRENREAREQFYKIQQAWDVRIKPVCFDVTSPMEIKTAFAEIVSEKRPIDGLVHVAGITHGGLFQMTPITAIREVFDVNFFAALELTQRVLKIMIRQQHGSIVHIGSISGLDLKGGNSAYGVSKAALMAWTKTLAAELGDQGVRINAIAPGLTDTRMAKAMEEKAGAEMIRACAMKRLGKPEEIASVIAFLLSDEASFVHGQILRVDGGRS